MPPQTMATTAALEKDYNNNGGSRLRRSCGGLVRGLDE